MIAYIKVAEEIKLGTKLFNIIKRDNILDRKSFLLPVDTKTKRRKNELIGTKLCKILYKENINNVILANDLLRNKIVKKKIKSYGINILQGDKLDKLLLPQIVETIAEYKNSKMEEEKVSILTNDNSEIILNNIFEIARKTRNFDIVTNHIGKFTRISDYLYNELGILIRATNNAKRGLLNSNIIINVDFDQNMINKYNINPKAIIVNLPKNIKIISKKFSGINIKSYNIIIPKEYKVKGFNKKYLYEGIIYNYNISQALDKIEKDEVKIRDFIGKNGIINKKEFLCI